MLSDEQIVFYKENGYVLVPGMFTPDESAAFRVECHELADRLAAIRDIDATWASVQSADGAQPTKVLACHDVQFQSAALSGLIVDERLTGAAASIIGEVREEPPGRVLSKTAFGGHRMIDMLVGDPLPRIC